MIAVSRHPLQDPDTDFRIIWGPLLLLSDGTVKRTFLNSMSYVGATGSFGSPMSSVSAILPQAQSKVISAITAGTKGVQGDVHGSPNCSTWAHFPRSAVFTPRKRPFRDHQQQSFLEQKPEQDTAMKSPSMSSHTDGIFIIVAPSLLQPSRIRPLEAEV